MQPSHSAKSMEDTLSKKTSTSSPPPRRDVTPSPKRAKLELAEPDMEGLSMEGPTSSAQQSTMARESSTAHKETFKVPPKGPKPPISVKEFYESYVLPKLDGPGPLFVEPFLHVWVPHRYCEVTCHKECPNIQELRDYMRYVYTGHKSLSLWLTVEYRASVGYRVMLKSASNNQQQQLGSYVFRGMRDGKISKAAFLWVDMLQLIMLLAKRIEADPLIVKSWFEEAKLYLTTSNIGLELS